MVNFIGFRAEIKKQLALRKWTYADLAKAAGYKSKSIESLMCGKRTSDRLCKTVAKALDIPESMAS